MRHAVLLILMALIVSGGPVAAQPALTSPDVEAYLEGFLPYALHRGDIAGAVVAVVKDGETILLKGYGVADVVTGTPVNPAATLFRPGSISKSFTATAVMQLVEKGRLSLDRDVNEYLDFRVPSTFAPPITLRHLLSHTAGFADVYKNVMLASARATPSIEHYVKNALPPRIFPAGTVVAYSNYGATLAGYIVQRIAGEPYESYVAKHIFAPLGMSHSTFVQPVPASLSQHGPRGYLRASHSAAAFEFLGTAPAGALSTTGADMARYMLAHLGGGRENSVRLMSPATAATMHQPAFRSMPGMQAMALGFYGEDRNGRRIIGHAGDLISFHADMHLLIEDKVGLFIAMNSLGKDAASTALRTALFRGFVDRYFPAAQSEPTSLASAMEHGLRIAGRYQSSRRPHDTPITLGGLFTEARLVVNADATVELSALKGINGVPKRWREVEPYVWREVHGTAKLAAVLDGNAVRFLTTDDVPPVAVWQPLPVSRQAGWNLPVLVATLMILLAALAQWPFSALIRRHYRLAPDSVASRPEFYRTARIVAGINFVVLMGWLGFLLAGAQDLTLLADASDPFLRLLQVLGAASVLGTIPVMRYVVSAWRVSHGRWWLKISSSALAFASLATVWFIAAFHLLSLDLNY